MFAEVKRIAEFIFSLLLLVAFFPLLFTLSVLSAIDTKQFPIFSQQRGLTLSRGRLKIYKLRTIKSIEHIFSCNNNILRHNIEQGGTSSFGIFLRQTGLDELPQLFNILKGEMNFVGPRPLAFDDLQNIKKYFPELYDVRNELNVKPGLTGFWQINKDENISVENLVAMDKYYVANKSVLLDAAILFKSTMLLLSGKHKDSLQFEFTDIPNTDFEFETTK